MFDLMAYLGLGGMAYTVYHYLQIGLNIMTIVSIVMTIVGGSGVFILAILKAASKKGIQAGVAY